MKRFPLLALLLLAAASCAPAAEGGGPRYRNDRIVREQLEATGEQYLYGAIQRLQPGWLQGRGPVDFTVGVFVDRARAGDVETLKTIPTSQVAGVHYLGPRALHNELLGQQAANLYSAIMVSTLRM